MPSPRDSLQPAVQVTRAARGQLQFVEHLSEAKPVSAPVHANGQAPDGTDLRPLRDALHALAEGLTALAAALDATAVKQLGNGLGEAADYLDKQLTPAAEDAARQLEETSELLRTDSLRLAELLRAAPLDFDVIQQVHDAMGRFATGTEALARILELPRLGEIRKGIQGLETALNTGGQQVEGLAAYYYPVVYFEGWRPRVREQLFWPSGGKIASGMYHAAAGVKAADKELETLGTQLPKVRAGLEGSKQILERSRDTLATVLKHRHLIEPLVKSLPEAAARLAEDLPKLTKQLSDTLRDTRRLKEVAAGLRASQGQLERSVAAWPEVRRALVKTAEALRTNRDQLDKIIAGAALKADAGRAGGTVEPTLTAHHPVGAGVAEPGNLAVPRHSFEQFAEAQALQNTAVDRYLEAVRWTLLACAAVLGLLGSSQLVWVRS
jgi:ABC-type transporter Mla subunit MlaD